jgi:hypothetical protein
VSEGKKGGKDKLVDKKKTGTSNQKQGSME